MQVTVSTKGKIVNAFARYRPYVDDWAAFVEALSRPLPTVVWVNPLRLTPEEGGRLLQEAGFPATPIPWFPGAFRLPPAARPSQSWLYAAGLIHIQEEVSLLPVALMTPQPGERVLDLCAAPGGKTALIATAMGGRGTVVANDVDYLRLRAVRHIVERLGLTNVSITRYNGANLPRDAGAFDRALVDAPCSCEGTARKNPEVLDMCGVDESLRHQGLQKALLRKAVQLCRPGGRIVYATCTFAAEENEAVVDAVLREVGEATVQVVPVQVSGLKVTPGFTEWYGQRFHPSLAHAVRVWPHHNDTGGFFVAVLEKAPDAPAPPFLPPVEEQRPEHLAPREVWLTYWEETYGVPPTAFAELLLLQRAQKRVDVVSAGHVPPVRPRPEAMGVPLVHTKSATPKPTTAAALLLAPHASRRVVDLTDAQVEAYLRREATPLTAAQRASCTGGGYLLVRYRGFGLGTALCRGERLESLFPKGWMSS